MFVGDRVKDIETERNVFFLEAPTSNTHTHMTGQQWLVGQVVPEEFFGFCNLFLTKRWSAKIFWPPGGHVTSENIFLRVYKMFSFVYVYI